MCRPIICAYVTCYTSHHTSPLLVWNIKQAWVEELGNIVRSTCNDTYMGSQFNHYCGVQRMYGVHSYSTSCLAPSVGRYVRNRKTPSQTMIRARHIAGWHQRFIRQICFCLQPYCQVSRFHWNLVFCMIESYSLVARRLGADPSFAWYKMKRLNSSIDDNTPIYIFILLFAILFLSFLGTSWSSNKSSVKTSET